MKYWIFQNNQVLGPSTSEELSSLASFSAESLVCPEGRKGTSMGDWQRAGMVPELSVALVKATSTQSVAAVAAPVSAPAPVPVASVAVSVPEPAAKEHPAVNGLQEKISRLEDVVVQLQDGIRTKDAEVAALQNTLAGKAQESAAIKNDAERLRSEAEARRREAEALKIETEIRRREAEALKSETEARRREAEALKSETEIRRREAEALKSETEDFKLRIAELEEKVSSVNRLTETIDKAVEAERLAQQDVEIQASTLAELTQELESLRAQLRDRLSAEDASISPEPAAEPAPRPEAQTPSFQAPVSTPAPQPTMPDLASLTPTPEPSPASESLVVDLAVPEPESPGPTGWAVPSEPPVGVMPALPIEETPARETAPASVPSFLPTLDLTSAPSSSAAPAQDAKTPSGAFDLLEMSPSVPPPADVVGGSAAAAAPPSGAGRGRKKTLAFAGALGVAALASVGYFMTANAPKKPAPPHDLAAPPPSAAPASTEAPAPAEAPAPLPPPDERQTAIDFAKEWSLKDGRTLGQALETLSPTSGNLSPWMAEPLSDGRVQVNYFARGSAPGAPTVAYEFEVDLATRGVSGRNPAARSVIAGTAAPPPAPPKPKPVKVKPKTKAKAPVESAPKPKAKPEPKPEPEPKQEEGGVGMVLSDAGTAQEPPAAPPAEPVAKRAKPSHAKRAAKASVQTEPKTKAEAEGKAEDASLLDDLLKE